MVAISVNSTSPVSFKPMHIEDSLLPRFTEHYYSQKCTKASHKHIWKSIFIMCFGSYCFLKGIQTALSTGIEE